ncbi:acyltransferase family protein [Erwinia papayae]|uniref:Acyltransferase family protein n=1 Tax=Erwinia papayae TaxID=206499 RepID=A0ABV3N252_9GAMM
MHTAEREEIAWINSLKGGCILLVVLWHVTFPGYAATAMHLSAGFIPARLWLAVNNYLVPLRMPVFFFVSGLLASHGILHRDWKQVLTGRVINLFYLYFIWGIIQWLMIRGVSGHIMGGQLSTGSNAAWAETPLKFIRLMLLAMSSCWYLYALGLFFLLAKLFRQQNGSLLLMAVVLNYAAVSGIIPGWGPASLAQYLIFFLLGVFHSDMLLRWSEGRRRNLPVWLMLVILAVAHLLPGLRHNLFLSVLSILFSIALCRQLNRWFTLRWLNWLGRNTLQIYVLHRIFIEFFGMSLMRMAARYQLFADNVFSLIWAAGFPVVMVTICVACSVAAGTLLNRGLGRRLFIYPTLLRRKCDV